MPACYLVSGIAGNMVGRIPVSLSQSHLTIYVLIDNIVQIRLSINFSGKNREIHYSNKNEWNGNWFHGNVGFFEILWEPQNNALEVKTARVSIKSSMIQSPKVKILLTQDSEKK